MKKIMFNDRYGLTQAVLEGRKTQTRRIIKLSHVRVPDCFKKPTEKDLNFIIKNLQEGPSWGIELCAPYAIGEEVAVAQRYEDVSNEVFLFATKVRGKEHRAGWGNKLFVRAYLMPHRIRITNVRVERLQDISEEDCLKEGIEMLANKNGYKVYAIKTGSCYTTAKIAFSSLIDKTCGHGTWDSNPYVFVYDFELIK